MTHVSWSEQGRVCPRGWFIDLFDDYPARAVSYEDHLSALAVLTIRGK